MVVSGIGLGLGVKLTVEVAGEGAAGVIAAARGAEKLEDAEKRLKAVIPSCKLIKQVTDITDRK